MSDKQELWAIYFQHDQDHTRPFHYGDYETQADALQAVGSVEGGPIKPRKTGHYQFDERNYWVVQIV